MSLVSPSRPQTHQRFRFGAVEVDSGRLTLKRNGELVEIEQKPLRVLIELLREPGELLSRDHLQDSIWQGRATVDSVLTNAIAKLRKALGPDDSQCIHTVSGIGYRFVGELLPITETLAEGWRPAAGSPVPDRERHRFIRPLHQSAGTELWEVQHIKNGHRLMYAVSLDTLSLQAQRRITAVARYMLSLHGERSDYVRLLDWKLSALPGLLEYEYAGETLQQWHLTEPHWRPMSLSQRLELFLQIADAVAAAHSIGVIHGQLDAEHIRISAGANGGWQLKLAYFDDPLPPPPAIDAHRESKQRNSLPPRSIHCDIRALGVLLYQFVTGELAPPLPDNWPQQVSDPLLAADIAAAISLNEHIRLSSAAELATRIRQLDQRRAALAAQQQRDSRINAAERQVRKLRTRERWLLAALAGVTTALLVLLMQHGKPAAPSVAALTLLDLPDRNQHSVPLQMTRKARETQAP